MEVSGQLHDPAALPSGKSSWYQLDRRLGGPQSRSGRSREEKTPAQPMLCIEHACKQNSGFVVRDKP
jgi:hypothetical protein